MDTQKAEEKGCTYPPAPSVEDDTSPESSDCDFDHDCYELGETYMQDYLAYERPHEDSDREKEEKEGKETPQILIEYTHTPAAASSTTSSSSSSPPLVRAQSPTPTAAYREHVAVPLHHQCPAQPRHQHAHHSPPAQRRPVPGMPLVQPLAVPALHSSYTLQHIHQACCANHARCPLERRDCVDGSAAMPERSWDTHGLENFARGSHGGERSFDGLLCRGAASDRYYCNRDGVGAARMHSGDNTGTKEAELFEKFAEVFNAMRRIDADILALKKLLEGLLLERFGARGVA